MLSMQKFACIELCCSVPRLLRMLACYDPDEAILMGEAYGFMAHKPVGYTYITGGGG